MNSRGVALVGCAIAFLTTAPAVAAPPVIYWLDSESAFVHEPCLGPCDCVSLPLVGTLRGAFELRLITVGDVFDFYAVPAVNFVGRIGDSEYHLAGSGDYRESTHLAHLHQMSLTLSITDEITAPFESDFVQPIGRLFPSIDIDAQTVVLGCSRFTVRLRASIGCPADFNLDGERNPDDLADFITCFFLDVHTPGACPRSDFNRDDSRDADDLSDFITAFFTC